MRRTTSRLTRGAAATLVLLAAAVTLGRAQTASSPPGPPADEPRVLRTTGSRVAIGRNIRVAADEEVTDVVVVVGGSLRIDGRVRDGVVVIGGNVEMGPRADVRGDVVLVGGRLIREPGAQLRGRVSDVTFGEWRSWSWGGWSVPTVDVGDVSRWLTLLGTVFRVSVLGLLMGIVLLVARAPVARVGRAAAAEPGRAFVIGVAVIVLFVPALIAASLGLVITLIGIPLVALLVPLAFCTAFIALILGFTAVACRLGEWIEDRFGWRSNNAFVAAAIGLLLVVTPTLVARLLGVAAAGPFQAGVFGLLLTGLFVELIVWTMGVGATVITGFGRWSTAPPPVPRSSALPAGV